MRPFDVEIFYGERVGVLGANGAGKSHFLRLLGGEDVAHTGDWRLGARVVPGLFAQTHVHPEWTGRTLVDLLWTGADDRPSVDRGRAMSSAAALRAADAGRAAVRHAVRRAAGPVPDPAARTDRRDPAAARRADRQPRRAQRRGARGGAGRPTTARCSRSPTTAGSPGRSTASWSSVPTGRCTSRWSRSSTRSASPGRADVASVIAALNGDTRPRVATNRTEWRSTSRHSGPDVATQLGACGRRRRGFGPVRRGR